MSATGQLPNSALNENGDRESSASTTVSSKAPQVNRRSQSSLNSSSSSATATSRSSTQAALNALYQMALGSSPMPGSTSFNDSASLLNDSGAHLKERNEHSGTCPSPKKHSKNTSLSSIKKENSGGGKKRFSNTASRDFRPLDWPKENDPYGKLGELSVAEQEQAILNDLLYVLIGIEGK